jgi:predicted DNA repair protein MutK
MLGGTYLAFEGAEKIWERVSGHAEGEASEAHEQGRVADEKTIVSSAVRTDFILSAEIMVISLNEVAGEPLARRAAILVIVAIAITVLVYGVVGLIVKMDDIGLSLARRDNPAAARFGRGLVAAMPRVLSVLSTVGIAAMIWVGGHILLVGFHDLAQTYGWHVLGLPYEWVHHAEVAVKEATGALGGLLGWLTNTVGSAVVGLLIGALVVAVLHLLPRKKSAPAAAH